MQWQYTPTLLNGVPVPVIMTVTVNFTLRSDPNVTLNITMPTGGTASIRMMDGAGVGTLDLPNVGKFGFTPLKGASPTGRSIAIYQVGSPTLRFDFWEMCKWSSTAASCSRPPRRRSALS